MRWSTDDTLKLLGLVLFLGAFAVVYQQLLRAQERLDSNAAKREANKAE